jgi:hypothetical protein
MEAVVDILAYILVFGLGYFVGFNRARTIAVKFVREWLRPEIS